MNLLLVRAMACIYVITVMSNIRKVVKVHVRPYKSSGGGNGLNREILKYSLTLDTFK